MTTFFNALLYFIGAVALVTMIYNEIVYHREGIRAKELRRAQRPPETTPPQL
jgi:hypothetical protein